MGTPMGQNKLCQQRLLFRGGKIFSFVCLPSQHLPVPSAFPRWPEIDETRGGIPDWGPKGAAVVHAGIKVPILVWVESTLNPPRPCSLSILPSPCSASFHQGMSSLWTRSRAEPGLGWLPQAVLNPREGGCHGVGSPQPSSAGQHLAERSKEHSF